jgi:phosphoserine aminotransferase
VNIVFRLAKDGKDGRSDLEAVFLREARKQGMIELAGHRRVGGIRVSLYNAVSEAWVETLVAFMKRFQAEHMSPSA